MTKQFNFFEYDKWLNVVKKINNNNNLNTEEVVANMKTWITPHLVN
jgi:hypothetical protein